MKVTLHVRPWAIDHQAREGEEASALLIAAVSLDGIRIGQDLGDHDVLVADLYKKSSIDLGCADGDVPRIIFETLHPALCERLAERYKTSSMILGGNEERFELVFTDLELVIEPVVEPARAAAEVRQL